MVRWIMNWLFCNHRWVFVGVVPVPRRMDLWDDEDHAVVTEERCVRCGRGRKVQIM